MSFFPAAVPRPTRRPEAVQSLTWKTTRTVVVVLILAMTGCGPSQASSASSDATSSGRGIELLTFPDDDASRILEAIERAKQRVLVEMYLLTSSDAVSALLRAKARGVDVRVLLEAEPFGEPEANQPAFEALAREGVDVRWLHRDRGLTHTKLIVVDGVTAFVLTLNLTRAGLSTNREYAVVDSAVAEVRWAEAVWNADAVGRELPIPLWGGRLIVSPLDARPRLTALIDGAAASIAVEMEELSDFDLVDRLVGAVVRGVTVAVVVPASDRSAATTAALSRLAAGGVQLRTLGFPAIHAKAVVTDQVNSYVGSINLTRASLDDNREVGVIWEGPVMARRLWTRIMADFASGDALALGALPSPPRSTAVERFSAGPRRQPQIVGKPGQCLR